MILSRSFTPKPDMPMRFPCFGSSFLPPEILHSGVPSDGEHQLFYTNLVAGQDDEIGVLLSFLVRQEDSLSS